MARAIGTQMLFGLLLATATPALGDGPVRRAAADEEIDVDASWYYQPPSQPTSYQPNPKAIIHRKALERAANRQMRLESKYAAGELPARPTVNPLQGSWQYTYPLGYKYGPPVVSNDWGNTQISLLGEQNRASAPWTVGNRGGRPNYNYR
jgi:hypothetical protein